MIKAPYDLCDYAEFWKGREYEDQAERIALKKFFDQISTKNLLLDIGGGYGRLTTLYAPLFKKCFIIDPAEKLLNEGKKNLAILENVVFQKGDSEHFPPGPFDVVLMVRVAHHLPNIKPTFTEIYKILQPQGCFIIEFANKIHFLAKLRSLSLRNSSYLSNLNQVDVRSEKAKEEGKIIFVNHHPKRIEELLKETGFRIVDKLSVSNFRHSIIKKIVPLGVLLFLENHLQKPLSSINFGPSVFLLCQKK